MTLEQVGNVRDSCERAVRWQFYMQAWFPVQLLSGPVDFKVSFLLNVLKFSFHANICIIFDQYTIVRDANHFDIVSGRIGLRIREVSIKFVLFNGSSQSKNQGGIEICTAIHTKIIQFQGASLRIRRLGISVK